PSWPDPDALERAGDTLASFPPLVFAGECDVLRERMAAAATGTAFVLQAGDCAETFAAATADNIQLPKAVICGLISARAPAMLTDANRQNRSSG
ncbi:MAG TPA: 3-deoxy-7-phosphoheptulonate synthase, partial [Candidatus Defluviicoccus seviourii]|nr:3-deoxy-7-phosphoheptulonate synthase [Candidatus Defluviicoccus seviourii]